MFSRNLQIYKRLVDLLSFPAVDAQAAAVGALYNLAEVNMDCRLKLASERWWGFLFNGFNQEMYTEWNVRKLKRVWNSYTCGLFICQIKGRDWD